MSTTETKALKLTTCERRALAFCQSLAVNDGGQIQVHWSWGGTYGAQASIYNSGGGLCYRTGGCGFDKLSSCLANVLRFLAPRGTDEHRRIWQTCGVGDAAVADRLAAIGWKLVRIKNSKYLDVFQLSRKALLERQNQVMVDSGEEDLPEIGSEAWRERWEQWCEEVGADNDCYYEDEQEFLIPPSGALEESERHTAIRELAQKTLAREGGLEIDNNAAVSDGDDNGAYIQAWAWLPFSGTQFDKDNQ